MIIREDLQLSYGQIVPSGTAGLVNSAIVDALDWYNHMLWIQFDFPIIAGVVTPPIGASSMTIILNAFSPASRNQNNQLQIIKTNLKTIDFTGPAPFDTMFSFGGKSSLLQGCVFYEYQITVFNNIGSDIPIKSVIVTKSNTTTDK